MSWHRLASSRRNKNYIFLVAYIQCPDRRSIGPASSFFAEPPCLDVFASYASAHQSRSRILLPSRYIPATFNNRSAVGCTYRVSPARSVTVVRGVPEPRDCRKHSLGKTLEFRVRSQYGATKRTRPANVWNSVTANGLAYVRGPVKRTGRYDVRVEGRANVKQQYTVVRTSGPNQKPRPAANNGDNVHTCYVYTVIIGRFYSLETTVSAVDRLISMRPREVLRNSRRGRPDAHGRSGIGWEG